MSTTGPQAAVSRSGKRRQPAARVLLAVCLIAVVQTCLVLLFAHSHMVPRRIRRCATALREWSRVIDQPHASSAAISACRGEVPS